MGVTDAQLRYQIPRGDRVCQFPGLDVDLSSRCLVSTIIPISKDVDIAVGQEK